MTTRLAIAFLIGIPPDVDVLVRLLGCAVDGAWDLLD